MDDPTAASDPRRERFLPLATAVFAFGLVVHTADHFRRGLDAITDHVLWAGNVNTVLSLVVIGLVFTQHRLAPLAAGAAGFGIALGVSATHLLPEWSAFSDPLPDGNVDAWSWIAVLLEIGGAAAMATAGLSVLRREGRLRSTG